MLNSWYYSLSCSVLSTNLPAKIIQNFQSIPIQSHKEIAFWFSFLFYLEIFKTPMSSLTIWNFYLSNMIKLSAVKKVVAFNYIKFPSSLLVLELPTLQEFYDTNDFMCKYLQSDTNLWQIKKNLNHVKFTLKTF